MKETLFVPKCNSDCVKNIEEFYSWINQLNAQVTPIKKLNRSGLAPSVSSSTSHLIKKLNAVVERLKTEPCNTLLIKKCSLQELSKDLCEYQQTAFATKYSSTMFRHFQQLKREEIYPRIYRDIPNDRKWAEDEEDRANLLCENFSSVTKLIEWLQFLLSQPGNTKLASWKNWNS